MGLDMSADRLAEGEQLIVAAFQAARQKGREDWRRMTTPVLKNRLLSLTNRQFNESEWNVPTFRHFLALYPGLISVDNAQYPAVAELLIEHSSATPVEILGHPRATPMTSRQRVRSDLWRAVLDYSSGTTYAWDDDQGAVTSVSDDQTDTGPRLPTVTRELFADWRAQFANDQTRIVTPTQAAAIERWRSEVLPTTHLPAPIRGQWNAELKRRVIELLEEWYESQGLRIPNDLVITDEPPTSPRSGDTEALRLRIQELVRGMTREELERVLLPATALLRTRR